MEKGESSTDQNNDDWIPNAIAMVERLYDYWETHFPETMEDKIADMEYEISMCILALNEIPQEKRQSEYDRTVFEYLKGRSHNAIPGVYKEEAEEHLKNAINLDPYLLDARICLGVCLTKKGDYPEAKSYYEFVLDKKNNSMILLQLAELELVCARSELKTYVPEDPQHHIDECIKYALRAVTRDDTERSYCLYLLGSAYFTSFILDGGWNHDKILLSLEAFEEAERIDATKSDPDIRYNCGLVNRFLENYENCLISLSDAAMMNPSLDASHQVEMTLQLLDKLEELVQVKSNDKSKGKGKGKSKGKGKGKSKGKSKGKITETSFSSLIQSLATIDLNPPYIRATLDVLTDGPNKGIAVVGAVRCLVKYEYSTPLYYVLCDSDENSFVLTVFGIQKEAIKQGDQVTLLEPFCKFVDFEWKGKLYEFKSVRVNLVEQVLVNGNALPPNLAIREPILKYS